MNRVLAAVCGLISLLIVGCGDDPTYPRGPFDPSVARTADGGAADPINDLDDEPDPEDPYDPNEDPYEDPNDDPYEDPNEDPSEDPSCRPGCDGNVAVSCETINGITTTIRRTCGDRAECRNGECDAIELPDSVTIRADFGSVDPIFVGAGPSGVLTVAGRPSFSTELPSLPDLWDADGTVTSPSLGDCSVHMSFTLNSSQVGVTLSGSGDACVVFLTNAADRGFTITFEDVPLQDDSDEIDVRLEMDP